MNEHRQTGKKCETIIIKTKSTTENTNNNTKNQQNNYNN